MTQRVLHRVQVGDMGFLQRVYGMTLRNKVRSCEISKTLNVKPLFQIERSELHWFSHVTKMSQENWQGKSSPADYTNGKAVKRSC